MTHPDQKGAYIADVHALLAKMLALPMPTVAAVTPLRQRPTMSTTYYAFRAKRILKRRRSRLGPTSSWWPYYLPIDRLARVRDQVKVPAGVDEVNP